jgi:hypothetical protein
MASVQSSDLAKRVVPITSVFASYKGGDGKEYNKDGLKAAGLQTEMTVAIPFFHKTDFESAATLSKAMVRVMAEWEKVRELTSNGTNVVVGKDGTEYALVDPTADPKHATRPIDFLYEVIRSGVLLAHQQVMGNAMRAAAKLKLGSPAGTSTGRGTRDRDI